MEKDYEGYSKAVKTVMREAGRGNLKGVHAPVANLIRAEDEFALAIETALGAAGQKHRRRYAERRPPCNRAAEEV